MNEIKKLQLQIIELAQALDKMNANAMPQTALTVKVANEVFGKTLTDLRNELTEVRVAHARATCLAI